MSTTTNTQAERNNQIVNTMVSQLGGQRFMMMTGSKPQYKKVNQENPEIAFKLTRNQSKANYLTVSYITGLDTYKMTFVKATMKSGLTTIEELENVHCDQLQSIFTNVTGLVTRL